jgi:gliding motility-associated-like protein
LWSGPNNYRSNTNTANIRNVRDRDTGIYTVVSTLNGCSSPPASVRLKVVNPVAGDTIPVQICKGGSYDFFGKQITTEGVHAHTLVGMSSHGCDSITYVALSYSTPPTDTFEVTICQGASYAYNGMTITDPGYYHDTVKTSGGCDSIVVLHLVKTPALQGSIEVSICDGGSYSFGGNQLFEAGTYIDSTRSAEGCDSLTILTLKVRATPTASASYDSDGVPCLGDTIYLHGEGGTAFTWLVNAREIGSQAELPFIVSDPEQKISLYVTNEYDCSDSAVLNISAVPCCHVFVPNAFTPNGDGRNDEFNIYSESPLSRYRLEIRNRWGQVVFTSGNPSQGWNGLVNGTPADVGTYFYQITGKCISGNEIFEKGDLTLIR